MNDQTNNGQVLAAGALPFSQAVKAGHLLFISGQIGVGQIPGQVKVGEVSDQVREGEIPDQAGADDDFSREVRQVMKNIGQVLQQHGLRYSHLVNVTIYLTDMTNYAATNKVYSEFFQGGFPSRVCIAVKELPLKARVEISAIALLP